MNNLKLSPAFSLVFFTVLLLTVVSGGTSLWLASQEDLSEQQVRVFENTSTTWQMGVGVIFGLLGSKATDLFDSSSNNGEEDTGDDRP